MPNRAYTLLYARGPFAGQIDPWAEDDHYFNQLHSGIIAKILAQTWEPLFELGYVASKEASLQIAEICKSDVSIHRIESEIERPKRLDYATAATAIQAEPGTMIDSSEPDFQAIYIRTIAERQLVTVIEIISPSNKATTADVVRYRQKRSDLFLSQGVNVVEIDLTRSVKRLLEHPETTQHPYHIAVFIPDDFPRVITSGFLEAAKRFAIPLRSEVVGVDLQDAYDASYVEAMIATQIDSVGGYIAAKLPFPSLLTDLQRDAALKSVDSWKRELNRLLSN